MKSGLLLSLLSALFQATYEIQDFGLPFENIDEPKKNRVPKKDCYSDWYELSSVIEDSDGSETFVLCPNTTFHPIAVNEHGDKFEGSIESWIGGDGWDNIWFFNDNIRLQCGDDGSHSNNCVFQGGESHLGINSYHDVKNIEVVGLTFTGATWTSIMAYGTKKSHMIFTDCIWHSNSQSSIDEDEEAGSVATIWWSDAETRHMGMMKVTFNRCIFFNNRSDIAVMMNNGGTIELNNCRFFDNGVMTGQTDYPNNDPPPVVVLQAGGSMKVQKCSNDDDLFYSNDHESLEALTEAKLSKTRRTLGKGKYSAFEGNWNDYYTNSTTIPAKPQKDDSDENGCTTMHYSSPQ